MRELSSLAKALPTLTEAPVDFLPAMAAKARAGVAAK
jgi:hypothetical protein